MDLECFAICSLGIYRECFIQFAKSKLVIFSTDSVNCYLLYP